MIGFTEAVIYGMYTFGKAYESCAETADGGYVYWRTKDDGEPHEAQSWDEFEQTWKTAMKLDHGFRDFVDRKLRGRRFRIEYPA